MFVHAVYFWLRTDLSDAERGRFAQWLATLCTIPSIRHGYVGVPAATDRPVIERTYSYALVLVLDDAAGEMAYQVHPLHEQFKQECSGMWTQLRIFDSEPAR